MKQKNRNLFKSAAGDLEKNIRFRSGVHYVNENSMKSLLTNNGGRYKGADFKAGNNAHWARELFQKSVGNLIMFIKKCVTKIILNVFQAFLIPATIDGTSNIKAKL